MSDTENTTTNNSNNIEELPQWARDQISEANAEAAKYRVAKKEAVEAAKEEVRKDLQEQMDKLEADLASKDNDLLTSRNEVDKLKAAIAVGIEGDKVLKFADLLKGENPDQLRSHAEELKELFGTTEQATAKSTGATDPSQGTGSMKPLNGDPLLDSIMGYLGR